MYGMLSIRLSKALEERLDCVARKFGRTKSSIIRQAIKEKIEEQESSAMEIERMEHLGKQETE